MMNSWRFGILLAALPVLSVSGQDPVKPVDAKEKSWVVADWSEWKLQETAPEGKVAILPEVTADKPTPGLAPMGETAKKAGVLVLGAGGAAAAIATALASAAPHATAQVSLYDPAPGKALALARRLAAHTQVPVVAADTNDPAGFDLVINASPLGLTPDDALPCDVQRMEPHAAVMDIVMKHQPSRWVRAARARGLQAQPGFEMLIQQTAPYLNFFGLHHAAELVRSDATFLREQLYPSALQGEIRGREPHQLIPALL